MVGARHRNSVRAEMTEGIRSAVLGRTGFSTNTGGGEEAALLLSELTWAESTWTARATQVARWLRFCDEDMRDALPAGEGDVLAYIGFLSLERRVSPASLPQYVSAVSRYHELHYLPSPTKTPLVRALVQAYRRDWEKTEATQDIRIGLSAAEARYIVEFGMTASSAYDVGCCAATTFAFVFQCRLVSLLHLMVADVVLDPTGAWASLFRRKGKLARRALRLFYPENPHWGPSNPIALLRRWVLMRPPGNRFFNVTFSPTGACASLQTCVARAVALAGIEIPTGCYFSSHSPRIGGFNELLGLQYTREFIMHRLDWVSEAMLRVYTDTRIVPTEHSRLFFAHMHPAHDGA